MLHALGERQIPHAAAHEAVRHVGVAHGAVGIGVQRVEGHLGVVTGVARHHGGLVRQSIDHLGEGVVGQQLEALREALLHLHEAAVVDGVATGIEQADAAEVSVGPRVRPAIDCDIGPIDELRRFRRQREVIDVARAAEVRAAHAQIADRQGIVLAQLHFVVHRHLVRQRLHIIRGHGVDIGRPGQGRGSAQNRWVDRNQRRLHGVRPVQRIGLHLDAVLRMRRADQDGCGAAIVHTVAAADDLFAAAAQTIGEAHAAGPVVGVFVDAAGIDVQCSQRRIRVLHQRLGIAEQVVAAAVVERQPVVHAPGVLHEEGDFVRVRIGGGAIGTRAGEALRVSRRAFVGPVGQRVEDIRAAEVAGEEVPNAFKVQIHAHFVGVLAAVVGQRVDGVHLVHVGVARAKAVPADRDHERAVLADLGFGLVAVGRAGGVVTQVDEPRVVDHGTADHLGVLRRQIIGVVAAVAGAFAGRLVARVFEVLAVETMVVVPDIEELRGRDVVVDPHGVNRIFKPGGVGRLVLTQFVRRLLRDGVAGHRDRIEDRVRKRVALGFVVVEEEQLVLPVEATRRHHRTAQIGAVLVEVVGLLDDAARVVEDRVGVHRLIAEEPEDVAVVVVRTALGDDVHNARARAPGFGSVAGSVHLELLHGFLREGVGIARPGAAGALAEEGIVGIPAIDEERVRRAPLAAEG